MNLIAIPARYYSSRFPGKVLKPILGKPMIQWVYEAVQDITIADIVVVTDDKEIWDTVKNFGGNVEQTHHEHRNGTTRIKEILEDRKYWKYDTVVNLQADEPLIQPAVIFDLLSHVNSQPDGEKNIATLARPMHAKNNYVTNRDVVKVVTNEESQALYFSRAPLIQTPYTAYQHIGVYVYPVDVLMKNLPPAPIEDAENLEQLRYLYFGYTIDVLFTEGIFHGVDVESDIEIVEDILRERGYSESIP